MGGFTPALKVRRAPASGSISQAIAAARAEIAQLALQRAAMDKRIEQLQAFIRHCAVVGGSPVPRTLSYAEHAMSLLAKAGRPMSAGQLVDALAAAGTPVRGRSRRHRVTTLAISLKRRAEVTRTPQGYVLTSATTRRGNAHGS